MTTMTLRGIAQTWGLDWTRLPDEATHDDTLTRVEGSLEGEPVARYCWQECATDAEADAFGWATDDRRRHELLMTRGGNVVVDWPGRRFALVPDRLYDTLPPEAQRAADEAVREGRLHPEGSAEADDAGILAALLDGPASGDRGRLWRLVGALHRAESGLSPAWFGA